MRHTLTPRPLFRLSFAALLALLTTLLTALTRQASAQSNNGFQFSAAAYTLAEGANAPVTITVTRTGGSAAAASVDYSTLDGTATQRRDYVIALGTLNFAPGETSKTFSVLVVNDNLVEGDEFLTLALGNPKGVALAAPNQARLTITDDDAAPPSANPINDPEFFVRQLYLDFLNRQPDQAGLNFWVNQITSCGADAACREARRASVAAAFFLAIEFQETGFLAYHAHRAAFGSRPTYAQFMRDTQALARGVVVGQGDWQAQLEANKRAYFDELVTRPEFVARYPASLTNAQYVDALLASAGLSSGSLRDSLVARLNSGALTRATALREVAETEELRNREFNPAFVLAGYFGFFRLDPSDIAGGEADYQARLGRLNQFNGDFMAAGIIRDFINSPLYTGRFGAAAVDTPTGTQVLVPGGEVSVRMASVGTAGATTFTPINPASAGALPAGFQLAAPALAFDVTTTAAYTPPVEVCFTVPAVTDAAEFSRLRVLHGEGGQLVDRTSRQDFATKTVCASVTTLSPFVLARTVTPTATIQFAAFSATVAEGLGDILPPASDVEDTYGVSAKSVAINVSRIGDTSGVTLLRYSPVAPGAARCDTVTGRAEQRCDYVGGYGTVRFRPGETEKQVVVFITDDSYAEGVETFQLRIHSAQGGQTGASDTVTITIEDNDTQPGAQNPILSTPYFARQQYIDFLRREPELTGLRAWVKVLEDCPNAFNLDANSPSAQCDRVAVASSFFRSTENFIKGYYAFRFYRAALGRRPTFEEFSYDLSRLTSDVAAEVLAARSEFPEEFAAREEFKQKYDALAHGDFVETLVAASGLQITAAQRQQWKDALAAGTLTRPAVLRELAESAEAQRSYYNEAFVHSLYTGFLGRDPEQPGFNNWLAYLNANPQDFRTMVGGFINSLEYRLRFGPSS